MYHENLKHECTNYELSKKLYELGIKQGNHYMWLPDFKTNNHYLVTKYQVGCMDGLSAYTVAQLGQVLRELNIQFPQPYFKGGWQFNGYNNIEMLLSGNEADARAQVLIFYLESKLASVEQVNAILERVI